MSHFLKKNWKRGVGGCSKIFQHTFGFDLLLKNTYNLLLNVLNFSFFRFTPDQTITVFANPSGIIIFTVRTLLEFDIFSQINEMQKKQYLFLK